LFDPLVLIYSKMLLMINSHCTSQGEWTLMFTLLGSKVLAFILN
jgi:hypothetical protein